ncbi:MAG TPA: CBS domain-containing protein [Nitrospiraceae bacterium]|nr:CBS domain-containing protein [Nitrospiraceae bacterium]
MSTLAQVMRKKLKVVPHTASIKEAASRMRDERVSALFVEKGGSFVGIVTDTDLVRRGVAEGVDIGKTAVETIMTSPIVTIDGIRTVQDAHDMMGDLSVRHLGVTERGQITGVVSVRDLLVYFKSVSEPKIAQD